MINTPVGAAAYPFRGLQDLPVASCFSPPVRRELVAFIKRAMTDGDMLPNPADIQPTRRRALIIAPQYREPGHKFDPLPSTAADVKLIYELLVRSGYEPQNIRILCDVCSFNGRAHPTRENILHSLEWLVAGATEGDYRFLHFSGHGDRVETDSSKGKECRIVTSGDWSRIPGGWDTELSLDKIKSGRVFDQTIAESELVYYNEAIVTRICEENDPDLGEEEEPDSAGKVWDQCIMDCCASGRILNLSKKLQGSGFRGKSTQLTSVIPPLIIPPSFSASSAQEDALVPSSPGLISPTLSSMASIVSTMVNVFPQMARYARIAMQESIPERERNMDRIQARIFAWSACHQRQLAWDMDDDTNGLLTRTFTETCIRLGGAKNPPSQYSYNMLFEEVSTLVAERRAASDQRAPQFVQLWTSLNQENRTTETSFLDSYVEF